MDGVIIHIENMIRSINKLLGIMRLARLVDSRSIYKINLGLCTSNKCLEYYT